MSLIWRRAYQWLFVVGDYAGDGIDEEARERVRQVLALADAKLDAAEAMWLHVGFDETRRLDLEVARALADALATLPTAARDRLEAHSRALASAARAVETAETSATGVQSHRQLTRHAIRLRHALGPLAATRSRLWLVRTIRVCVLFGLCASLALAVRRQLHRPLPLTAVASASADVAWDASRAVDRDVETEWWLPDGALGWIEVSVVPARDVRTVRLLDAKSIAPGLHATRDYRIELMSEGKVVAVADGFFGAPTDQPTWVQHGFGAKNVDKVKVTIKSYFGRGAGLGEILVE